MTKGKPKSYSITGDSGKENLHWFCQNCGSSLYTELEVMPDMTCVKTGSLDKVAVEFYVIEHQHMGCTIADPSRPRTEYRTVPP